MDRFVQLWRRRRSTVVWPRWGGGSITAVVLLVVATLLGYGYLYARMVGPRAAGTGAAGLDAACRRPPVFFPGNAAFRGAGPHPVAVFQQRDQSSPPVWARVDAGGGRSVGSRQDSAEVQLVACAERVQEERTRQVCRLGNGETPLYRAVYRVRIVEARTGRGVSDVVVRPRVEECPRFVQLDSEDPRAYTLPSAQDYARQLANWVDDAGAHGTGAGPGASGET